MNILFIMFDQLRFDYLSCAGHPFLETPHLDRLASKGVRFDRAYVQSPVCGASRMSTYTGRYCSSHGATWNGVPLKVGEMTLGDHLRPLGMDCWLIGKTHMKADKEGLARLGIAPDSVIGVRHSECGFDAWARDDGLWGQGPDGFYDTNPSPYNAYLKSKGYDGDNPWADYANAGLEGEEIASGWFLENADKPANIREEDSETPWLTSEAIRFIEAQGDKRWLCHLSYIKPHWPYIVPAPYHDMYGANQVLPPVRSEAERETDHPVYRAFMDRPISSVIADDAIRAKVVPAYMGLVKQCDDQMGRLFDWLEETGRMENTMIVVTSDHGDYLGDHWMGEKDLFHDPSVKVPMIIFDPRAEADATRGTVSDALVEQIDLVPTFIEAAGGASPGHIVEGRSLTPLLHGDTVDGWRTAAVSEYDYSMTPLCTRLGVAPEDARMFMVVTDRWKLTHFEGGFRPMLFDLQEDPDELTDLGASELHREVLAEMYEHLLDWALRRSQRTTLSEAQISARRGASRRKGILLFLRNASEAPEALTEAYRGKVRQRYVEPSPD